MRTKRSVIGVALLAAGCGGGRLAVERVVDGHLIQGRFVSSEAYAAYAAAVLRETRGDPRRALELYQQALDEDPDSAEILTRLGALRCRLGQPDDAARAFQAARGIDRDYAPTAREEGRCLLRQGRPAQALELGLRAVALDPADEEASVLVADVYAARGDPASARQWMQALLLFRPDSPRARAAVAGERRPTSVGREPAAMRAELDQTLVEGRLPEARHLARAAAIEPAELALRAVALGRADLGGRQAALVLAADPRSADAWVAGLAAADLGRDESTFHRMLGALDSTALSPGPLGSWVLAEVLARRLGRKAAVAWLEAGGQLGSSRDSADALEKTVKARVEALIRE